MTKKIITLQYVINFVYDTFKGKCLETKYINSKTKMKFKCKNDHVFEAQFHNIIYKHWCPYCSNNAKLTIKEIQEFIKEKGFILSTEYSNNHTKLQFKCNVGHIFYMSWNSVKSANQWCPYCARQVKPTIEQIFNFIQLKYDGYIMPQEYINAKTKLKFKCKNDHTFLMTWGNVRCGHWCPKCAKKLKPTISEISKYIEIYNAKLITQEYINNRQKLEIECKNGHVFNINWSNLQQGYWCKECSTGKGQKITKLFFEQLFDYEFKSGRYSWLKNPKTNIPLELDGYCQELGIAFEYQGRQHYEVNDKFHLIFSDLIKQQEIDLFKLIKCKERGIILIQIPEFRRYLKICDLKEFIKIELIKQGYKIPEWFDLKSIDMNKIYRNI